MHNANRPFAGPLSLAVRGLLACLLAGILLACGGLADRGAVPDLPGRPDPGFNRLFTRSGPGWTGGDGTLSLALPDGRTLWLFGDSFLGTVRPDGSRPLDSPLIRNCLVIQDGAHLETRHGGTLRHPEAFLVPEDPEAWYWPGAGTHAGRRAQIFYHRYRQVSEGIWGWAWDGTVIAVLTLPELAVQRVTELPTAHGVVYGAALLERHTWVYIFGTEWREGRHHLHVARAPRHDLAARWQFWTGARWASEPAASRAILAGVGRQFGVVALAGGLGLVTMDLRQPFSNRIVLYSAQEPTGPWRGPVAIYQAPEADREVAAYNAFVHPQFAGPDGQLISYNLNHVHNPDALYADAALYRPRFIRADLARLIDRPTPSHRKDIPWP